VIGYLWGRPARELAGGGDMMRVLLVA
jgi:hypothetical protein